jgi:hypothetical protein
MRFAFSLAAVLLLASPCLAQDSEAQIGQAIQDQANDLFLHRDFKGLNALADRYRASSERTPGGIPKLALFYAGVNRGPATPQPSDSEWKAIFLFAEDWVKTAPSPAAYIARAEFNIRYGWQQYGADGAATPERMKSFRAHIQTAHQQLDAVKAIAGSDPEWANAMSVVEQGEKAPDPSAARQTATASAPLVIPQETYAPGDEINVRSGVQVQARVLFEQGKFADLNAMARELGKGGRTPAGTQKLRYFYEGLLAYAGYQTPSLTATPNVKQWQMLFGRVQGWIKRAPSPAAYIALAKFHQQFGWAWRGDGMADTVSDSAWAPYREQLKIAHDILMAHKAQAASDPEWYVTMEDMAREQGWGEAESQKLYDEALARFPDYDRIYFAIANRLQPKWGGSWEAVEKFADKAAGATKSRMGDMLYTRIYEQTLDCGCEAFSDTQVDWPRMRGGFQQMLKRFPEPWNANRFAHFACQAQDRETAKAVLAKLSVVTPAWEGGEGGYQQCKAWAEAS